MASIPPIIMGDLVPPGLELAAAHLDRAELEWLLAAAAELRAREEADPVRLRLKRNKEGARCTLAAAFPALRDKKCFNVHRVGRLSIQALVGSRTVMGVGRGKV